MGIKKKAPSKPSSATSFPYRKTKIRIPREISSAASLWLDLFQQAIDLTVTDSPGVNGDKEAINRARILADEALSAFQDRFPGVHP
jgi:hypothetical protein